MTIEYKDSKRIVALSTDILDTPDINDTFETDTKLSQSGSVFAWDSTDKRVEGTIDRTTTNHNWIYDLGVNLSSTKFILDFQLDVISHTDSTGTSGTNFFMITERTDGNHSQSGDAFSFTFQNDGSGGKFGINAKSSGDMESGNTWGSDDTVASNTTYYMRMIRDGDDFTCIRYSDTWGGTVAETLQTTVSGISGLRYWRIQNYNGATSSYNGTTTFAVDNLKLYNGISSTTNKPTNVQDNSLLVEKDTANRYWFTAESENTKTVDENFDSTGLLTWTELHSANIGVDSSTNERLDFDFKRDGTNDTAYHQLSSALSDSAWVMDFDLTFSTLAQTGGSDAICGFIGVSASYEADNSDSHDGMYLQIVESNTKNRFQVTAQNNSTLVGQAVSEGTQFTSTTPSTTTFYVRLIRNGNDLTGQFFSTSARTGTATEEKTQTISGITGLSYITIKNLDFSAGSVGSNAVAGYIDNLKIYDGVTSTTAPATWTMQPTRFDLSTSTGWTTTGSNCSVDTTGEYLEGSSSTNDDRATKALGITLSDTKFVIRQKMELVTVTSSGNYGQLYFGYTDKDNSTTVLGNRDGIGITIRTTPDMLQSHADGQAWQTTATLSTTPASSTTYYLELIRNSSTSITLNLYSDSDYSTLVETKTNTIASTIVGLNHITIGGWDNSSGGVITVRFSNIEIYNGVTSIN